MLEVDGIRLKERNVPVIVRLARFPSAHTLQCLLTHMTAVASKRSACQACRSRWVIDTKACSEVAPLPPHRAQTPSGARQREPCCAAYYPLHAAVRPVAGLLWAPPVNGTHVPKDAFIPTRSLRDGQKAMDPPPRGGPRDSTHTDGGVTCARSVAKGDSRARGALRTVRRATTSVAHALPR